MKKIIFGILMLLAGMARAQTLAPSTPVKSIVPYNAKQTSNVSISTGTAVELTGNTTVATTNANIPTTAGNANFGVSVLNLSTTANIFCCYNNSACSVSAGANQGWPILFQPAAGNFNWQYFSIPTWEPFYCVATAVGVTAEVVLYK